MKRLDRILAERTGFSRKEISKMIRSGRTCVDGICVKNHVKFDFGGPQVPGHDRTLVFAQKP